MTSALLTRLLVRYGLQFADPADEAAFADRYLRSTIRASQLFLVLAALIYYSFFVWDRIIDPAHSDITHAIRGLVIAPALVACAASLFWEFPRRHIEGLIMVAVTICQVGICAIYSILAGGFDYAGLAFVLMFLGATTMFPVRARLLIAASLFMLVTGVAAHILADNARPGWLLVNILAILSAIGFGAFSSFIRETAARQQFMTDRELAASRARIDELLYSMLPSELVTRIQAGETSVADSHGEISIIFADLAGFTALARRLSPSDLVKMLNTLFSTFDRDAERLGIDRIKTIGDAYMAVGGLMRGPAGYDHVEAAAEFAFAMQRAVKQIVREMGYPIDIRVGLHVGPVVAGVIGVRRPAFDCWGDAVNLAARLESRAEPGTIMISESAYWRLKPKFDVDALGELDLKGIGSQKVYRLNSRTAGTELLLKSAAAG